MKSVNKLDSVEIARSYGIITLPRDVLEEVLSTGKYITCTKIKRSYGPYIQVMVCKKECGRLVLRQSLARYILKAPAAKHVDHIDRNPMNNVRENLRLVSASENGANRKKAAQTQFKYKGIAQKKPGRGFYAVIKKDGVRYSAGPFGSEAAAAREYDNLAIWLFGKHAALNFDR